MCFYTSDHKNNQLGLVAFAGRPLTESERSSVLDPDLNLLSRKFQLLGVASVEFQVSRETSNAVSELRSANIHTLLLSSNSQNCVFLFFFNNFKKIID